MNGPIEDDPCPDISALASMMRVGRLTCLHASTSERSQDRRASYQIRSTEKGPGLSKLSNPVQRHASAMQMP